MASTPHSTAQHAEAPERKCNRDRSRPLGELISAQEGVSGVVTGCRGLQIALIDMQRSAGASLGLVARGLRRGVAAKASATSLRHNRSISSTVGCPLGWCVWGGGDAAGSKGDSLRARRAFFRRLLPPVLLK